MINHSASKELLSFWTDESDPNPPPPPLPPITNSPPLGKEEDIIVNHLKLATEKHLNERKRNVTAWIKYGYDKKFYIDDSYDVGLRRRATLGYFPADLYDKLCNHLNSRKLSDKVAQQIVLLQIRTWLKIKRKFWKDRFENMENQVAVKLLKSYRYQCRDET